MSSIRLVFIAFSTILFLYLVSISCIAYNNIISLFYIMQELKQLTTPNNYDKFDKKIIDKQFLLGKFYDTTISSLISPACSNKHHQIKKFPKSKTSKLLTAQNKIYTTLQQSNQNKNENERINVIEPSKDISLNMKYEIYMPLNKLWCRYMADLLQKQSNKQSRELKVLRSDFHGAYITVVHSKNQMMIGLEGIVVKETLKTFQIVSRPNVQGQLVQQRQVSKPKIILKQICIFLVTVSTDTTFIVNGNVLVFRPSDRIKHKFKFKKAETLNHEFMGMLDQIIKEDGTNEIEK